MTIHPNDPDAYNVAEERQADAARQAELDRVRAECERARQEHAQLLAEQDRLLTRFNAAADVYSRARSDHSTFHCKQPQQ